MCLKKWKKNDVLFFEEEQDKFNKFKMLPPTNYFVIFAIIEEPNLNKNTNTDTHISS